MPVDEKRALRDMTRGDETALGWVMNRYGAYVYAIVYNILGETMGPEDTAEICSDVFFTLWSGARKVRPGKLKAWLGGVARNKAREKLRSARRDLPLEEDVLLIADADPVRDLEDREQAAFLQKALLGMGYPDREIFLRHYYYYQPLTQIAWEMGMNLSTVKTRLRRGREKLKDVLREGGYDVGN